MQPPLRGGPGDQGAWGDLSKTRLAVDRVQGEREGKGFPWQEVNQALSKVKAVPSG